MGLALLASSLAFEGRIEKACILFDEAKEADLEWRESFLGNGRSSFTGWPAIFPPPSPGPVTRWPGTPPG